MNQEEIEKKYLKNQLIPRLKEEAKDILKHFNIHGLDIDIVLDILSYLLLYKRMTVQTIAGLMYKKMEGNMDKLSFILENMAKMDLVDWDGNKFITRYVVDCDTQKELDQYCYPLPMIEEPRKVKKNNDSPYYTIKKESLILKDNYTDEDINLDYLNHQNHIQLELNNYAVAHNQNTWKSDSELSKQNFERFNSAQKDILSKYADKVFYLTWKYDKRGRSYDSGYHIHIQSNDYGKAIIQFHNKEPLNS